MKKNYFILLATALIFYSTAWAQVTSFGGVEVFAGTAGNVGTVSDTFIGHMAGDDNQAGGTGNTFIGYYSGADNTIGDYNTFLGYHSGKKITTGSNNVFIGKYAGYNQTGGTSNKLFIDNSATNSPLIWGDFYNDILNFNGDVGIGTATPSYPLEVHRSGSTRAQISIYSSEDESNDLFFGNNGQKERYSITSRESSEGYDLKIFRKNGVWSPMMTFDWDTGNVGIGTETPEVKLHVNGAIRGHLNGGALRVSTVYGYVNIGPKNGVWSHFETNNPRFYFNKGITVNQGLIGSYDENLQLQTSGITRITVSNSNGNVGIGTGTPHSEAKLDVNGNVKIGDVDIQGDYDLYVENGILTEKVKVAIKTTGDWSDYVFEPDYKLKSLPEVEAFVKENKHLPGIPSAEEVIKEGLDMAQMDAKLLEKIEELILYTIQQQKEIEVIKKENHALKARIEKLEND